MSSSLSLRPLPESSGHTAIYKQHKYFARRPHNQFAEIIARVTKPGNVILDCMAGGGVTLVEGLTLDRRVLSIDINPIASLVQAGQVNEFAEEDVARLLNDIIDGFPEDVRDWFTADCSACEAKARVRWYECSYLVSCGNCAMEFALRNDAKSVGLKGTPVAGRYTCPHCTHEVRAVDAVRTDIEYLYARVRCNTCGLHEARPVNGDDIELARTIARHENSLIDKYNLKIPNMDIPLDWDRQAEDALARKGFHKFSDLFTSRNRLIMAFLLSGLRSRADSLDRETYLGCLFVLSSLIRYVNNMTVSTAGWMDGRPVAWAKHAYWMPNQFVECNPFEYLEHRLRAMRQGQADRRSRFSGKVRSSGPLAVISGAADYCVMRADARTLAIPDGTVDAVITDPPFGSNVQYGELTELWSSWLGDLNPFNSTTHIDDEILVHRKKKARVQKTVASYELGLKDVFAECLRVLKPSGVLVFTFNNKDPKVWMSVMNAAISAGFTLERDDVSYQSEIRAYRDTAHLRFSGELQGDVLYTFRQGRQAVLEPEASIVHWAEENSEVLGDTSLTAAEELDVRIAIHLDAICHAANALQLNKADLAEKWMVAARQLIGGRASR